MAGAIDTIKQHALSLLSVSVITFNLTFWTVPLVIVVGARLFARSREGRQRCFQMLDWIYRTAVIFHSWWITRVLGVDIHIHGRLPTDPKEQLVVVSNHFSWFDILVLHRIVTVQGPIVKFLIKRELIYVPVVGWLCLALNFPRLNRGKTADGREHDYQSVLAAANALREEPGALLNFAEGTRFSATKRERQGAPYAHLLNPRSGGLRIMLESLPDAQILDCTLTYPDDEITFWQCLGGRLKVVEVWLDRVAATDITDVNHWLTERWRIKDERIEHSAIRVSAAR